MPGSKQGKTQDKQLASLLETVERLRSEKFPELPAALVSEILTLHSDPGASEGDVSRGVEQAVERHMSSEA